jgi:GNAT superfamily N-acetyltransferase
MTTRHDESPDTLTVRQAAPDDAESLAALINAAYRVEDFFKIGDRIDVAAVLAKVDRGRFIVLDDAGSLAGCVYIEVNEHIGYFGLLSISPQRQKQGLGARLIELAESSCRAAACNVMEIEVVNLRTELPPFYRKFGYVEHGTRRFSDLERSTQACHCIVMRKPL